MKTRIILNREESHKIISTAVSEAVMTIKKTWPDTINVGQMLEYKMVDAAEKYLEDLHYIEPDANELL